MNVHALGLELMALIRLRTTHAQLRNCLAALARMEHALETCRVTGEDCFCLKALVAKHAQVPLHGPRARRVEAAGR
ncbi:hypothetical protein OOT46_09280 [Aquabacterium sp. A7-Y]|uniref:hypothetical protein n=1 Tax=Aquabacterium sp. A7-Y TaxID=1349605 RepID=UPI00223D2D5F|nr:hypothetical protein [Aquabacterium sp. A7-Y]MCW7538038.1 hypothetical protein [Aquabacterium sp. A7-Y]